MNPKIDEVVRISLRAAKDWDLKQNPSWAARCYSAALRGILSKVVASCDNAADGVAQFEALGARECLRDVLRTSQALRGEIVAGKLPWGRWAVTTA